LVFSPFDLLTNKIMFLTTLGQVQAKAPKHKVLKQKSLKSFVTL